jgi:HPt (histidine-containing phosphotransfer) domain-containing protein
VIVAGNLAEATEVLTAQRFDAVYLTEAFPSGDLAAFCAFIKELDRRGARGSRTPILSSASSSASLLEFGIDEIVPDSMDADALTLAISRLASAVAVEKGPSSAYELGPELPILDVEELKAQVAHDDELLLELIDLYLTERARQSKEMATALAAGNYNELSRIAHTIKGSLGSLHADAARATAQALELAAREGDSSKCLDFFPYFEEQLDRLEVHLLALKQLLKS